MSTAIQIPRRVPSLWRVARTQFDLIDKSRRFSLLLAALAVGAIAPLTFGSNLFDAEFLLPFGPVMILTIIWPLLVWRGESPGNRTYHRILPVNHFAHDMIKVAAGAAWLCLGIGITLLGLLVSSLLGGFPELIFYLSPASFISYFTTALILYLLVSVIPILTNRPLEWMLGLAVGAAGLFILDETYKFGAARWISKRFIESELGFGVAFYGGYMSQPWDQIFGALDYGVFAYGHARWVTSTLLWLALGLALVCLASFIANEKQPA